MQVRSVTCFIPLGEPNSWARQVAEAGRFARTAAETLQAAGFAVQTTRLATQSAWRFPTDLLALAGDLWNHCAEAGFDYLSLGPVVVDSSPLCLRAIAEIPRLIRQTQTVFTGVLINTLDDDTAFQALRCTAEAIHEIAHTTEQGFGNLRLAMLSQVRPLCPFFPAGYHDGGPPAVALAMEGAALAVEAAQHSGTLPVVRRQLIQLVEAQAARLVEQMAPLAEQNGYRFAGIDFSWAPFPEEARSIGAAVEGLGVDCFGAPGTVFAASLLTECLRKAEYPHCGFNGMMMPVLEDAVLARRSIERRFSVNDLLLYSTVCGTGLDTLPLPGETSADELAGILLDVAAVAHRLNKPLTARLMPIPGAQAGDLTQFSFPYFANGRVLDIKGCGSGRLFGRAASSEASGRGEK